MKHKKITISEPAHVILEDPILNKGTAFTHEERDELGLHGLLPYHISTIEEQVKRRYANFSEQPDALAKYTFLNALQNRNEILFYRFILEHVAEMLPLIYTPTVGSVSTNYSLLYREQRGLYLSYPHRNRMEELIANYHQSDIDVIVVTDGERILGLGDLGVGGMAIPVGKLALYSLFGGIHPSRTLPIILDVGTNNQGMLEDPLYIGWRNQRIEGEEYDNFIDQFVHAVQKRYPNVLLQWEDFAKDHAGPLLNKYRKTLCSFNDDIQGTASVALAAVYSAVRLSGSLLKDQRVAILGAGSAGLGIANQLVKAMVAEGDISEEEARRRFYLIDRHGLVCGNHQHGGEQKLFAHSMESLSNWSYVEGNRITLLEVIENTHPTILIGVSTKAGAFTEDVIKTMAKFVKRPMIFPLSNPTSNSEAHPSDLIRWTKGQAIIATGSPFDPIAFEGKIHQVAQCNNVYIFPGVGLGLIAAKAKEANDRVFLTAANILSSHSPMLDDPYGPLFPTLDQLREVSKEIGIAVAKVCIEDGVSKYTDVEMAKQLVEEVMWYPEYPHFTRG